jgi:hypothetical protein
VPSKRERLTSVVANKAASGSGYLVMKCFYQRENRPFLSNLFVRVLAFWKFPFAKGEDSSCSRRMHELYGAQRIWRPRSMVLQRPVAACHLRPPILRRALDRD